MYLVYHRVIYNTSIYYMRDQNIITQVVAALKGTTTPAQ